jgi:5-methyltetrahydropteroyltriglutamate--homocysteine methyltransferase
MQRSTDRILTTHVGSLPRPDDLRAMLAAKQRGDRPAPAEFDRRCAEAVAEVVARQAECGTDVVSDGEMSKISYVGYVNERLRGMDERPIDDAAISSVLPTNVTFPDIVAHPDYAEYRSRQGAAVTSVTVCSGQVAYGDDTAVNADIARLKASAQTIGAREIFLNSASPGVLAMFISSSHHRSEDDYVAELAEAMRHEYEAIHRAGILLQIDCPDLAMSWHMRHWQKSDEEFLRIAQRNLEAINHATSGIPPEAMRLHICWGNYGGPHTHDLPVSRLFKVLARARPQAILFEGANPRHEHEWEDWQNAKLPDDKILVPGVIDSTTNFVEHPRLVAQRIERYTDIVGRERVIAGTDCGFGTFALRQHQVFPSVVWSKLKALSEGARIASARLW